MSFRTRLLLAFAGATLLSLSLLAIGVRRQLTTRLVAQHQRRVDALARIAIQDLARENAAVSARLESLARSLTNDNRVRLAVRGATDERGFLLDWAGDAMRMTGLAMLQLQDEAGHILSSGHFRNEFDRLEPSLPLLLSRSADRITIVSVRAPDGPFLVLAREDSLIIGDRRLTLVGGVAVNRALLDRFARDGDVSLSLVTPEGTVSSDSISSPEAREVSAEQPVAYIDAGGGGRSDSMQVAPARVVVTHSSAELDALRRDVNRWFALALASAVPLELDSPRGCRPVSVARWPS